MKRFLFIIFVIIIFAHNGYGQESNDDKFTVIGEWNYSNYFFDSKDTSSTQWPIDKMIFKEDGFFKITADTDSLIGQYQFVGPSIVLSGVSKNGIKQEGKEILFLSNLDDKSMTIQAKMETGIIYVEYTKVLE